MNWETHFVVNNQGRCVWTETWIIRDEGLKDTYRKSPVVQFVVELNAAMGVGVGQA